MKRLFLLLLLVPATLLAQVPSREALEADLRENIFRAGMNMDPYEYLPGPQTPAPKGYKPFYISHYGRHGSRSNWEGTWYADVQSKYTRAAQAGLLTPAGLAAKTQIDSLILLHDHMDGRLTYLGTQEHRQIAARMYRNYRRVFHNGSKKVSARSSIVPRVLVSMNAFTGELASLEDGLDFRWDTGEELMKILSTDSPKWVKDSVNVILARQKADNVPDTTDFLRRIFTDPAAGAALTGDPVVLMKQTFDMACGCAAFLLDDRLFRLFTEKDLYAYEQNLAMNFYLRQCNSVEFGDARMVSVNPLIQDIIDKADAAISTGEYCADLRFGHDYQIVSLLSLLGAEPWVRTLDDPYEVESVFRYNNIPMASNLQLVFWQGKRPDDILVRVLFNDADLPLPVRRVRGAYYRWADLRAYFELRLDKAHKLLKDTESLL